MTSWVSQAIHLNADTCVDVHADSDGVVLGQVGGVWLENLHLNPEQACELADYLTQGAAKCLAMRGEA